MNETETPAPPAEQLARPGRHSSEILGLTEPGQAINHRAEAAATRVASDRAWIARRSR